jgi:hypothetical protein
MVQVRTVLSRIVSRPSRVPTATQRVAVYFAHNSDPSVESLGPNFPPGCPAESSGVAVHPAPPAIPHAAVVDGSDGRPAVDLGAGEWRAMFLERVTSGTLAACSKRRFQHHRAQRCRGALPSGLLSTFP